MAYPNNNCGECPVWLAMESSTRIKLINSYCINCDLFMHQKFVRHIPTQCCYPIDEEGNVDFYPCIIQPEIDGKIFWEYVDKYVEKVIVPSDPYANHRKEGDR